MIVEDETAAYENLVQMVKGYDPSIEIVANTEGVEQTVRWLKANAKPDLIFMDIHLSDGSAFNIFEMTQVDVPIVFTTAYDQYAIDAFRVNSVDYLLKPIKPGALADALAKFRRLSNSDMQRYVEQLMALRPQAQHQDRLLLRVKDKLIPVLVEQIAFFYTADRTTQVYLKNGENYAIDKSLEQLHSRLDQSRFMRINKQYIIARDSVMEITIWFDNRLKLKLSVPTPEDIYISKNKSSEFKAWLIQ